MTFKVRALMLLGAMTAVATSVSLSTAATRVGTNPLVMSAPATLRQVCAAAASKTAKQNGLWKVICPSKVPFTLGPSFELYGATGGVDNLRGGYIIDCVGGSQTGHVHWAFASGDPSVLRLPETNAVGQPQNTITPVRTLHVGGQIATLSLVSYGQPTTTQAVVAWTKARQVYHVIVYPWAYSQSGGIGLAAAESEATDVAISLIHQLNH
jgi:hypothetical protein